MIMDDYEIIDSLKREDIQPSDSHPFPMLERAACKLVDKLYTIRCEGYALRSFGVDVSDETLEQEAKKNNWLRKGGIPLHNVGRLSEHYGSYTIRKFCCTTDDIYKALKVRNVVITVIDNTELNLPTHEARRQDLDFGEQPNHAIIIKSLNRKKKTIEILEPGVSDIPTTYPLNIFVEAWSDSAYYLVTVSNHTKYEPHPQDLSGVELKPELVELCEAIAENAHEVWARERKLEGWTYGPQRNDEKKLHPDMVPYYFLTESAKKYERQIAIATIKLVKKLGWELKKRK